MLVEVYAVCEEQCQREGVVDFAELMLRSVRAPARQPAAARPLPAAFPAHPRSTSSRTPTSCSMPGSRCWRAGPDAIQGANAMPGGAVFAVGDDDQSIYAFRGARVGNMADFEREFEVQHRHQAGAQLPQSFGNILDAANELISHNSEAPGQKPQHRGRPRRAGACLRVGHERLRRSAVVCRRGQAAAPRRREPQRHRAALPQQRTEPGDGNGAVQRRRALHACTAACASSSAPRSSTR